MEQIDAILLFLFGFITARILTDIAEIIKLNQKLKYEHSNIKALDHMLSTIETAKPKKERLRKMGNDERREVRAKVRSYIDKETGEPKNVYATIGTAWVSEHGSKISIQLETIPVGTEWAGKMFINKPYEKVNQDEASQEVPDHETVIDVLPTDEEGDKPIDLSKIPF